MASPAQLVETISRTTGVPLATLVDLDRRLVGAGLRTKTGRGRNVAQMTVTDAARLLTALLASSQATQAAAAVQRYAATRVDPARSSDRQFGAAALDDLAALPADHSFTTGLAAVIGSAGTGALARLAAVPASAPVMIEVFAFTRATRGRIRIAGLPGGLTASLDYGAGPSPGASRRDQRSAAANEATHPDHSAGDLEQSRRVTERTVFAIARLLTEGEQDDR